MNSLLDDVNALLRLKQGDLGRLEHIKKTLESRNVLYISDSKYLRELTKEYLEDHTGKKLTKFNSYDYPEYANRLKDKPLSKPPTLSKNIKESIPASKPKSKKIESKRNSFCGNCGNSIKNENFCPKCGVSLHSDNSDVSSFEPELEENITQEEIISTKEKKTIMSKKLFMGLGVLVIIIIVGAISMEGSILEKIEIITDDTITTLPTTTPLQDLNSKCGPGTVFDETANTCVLEGTQKPVESNSKCGPGTVFDDETNSCIIG